MPRRSAATILAILGFVTAAGAGVLLAQGPSDPDSIYANAARSQYQNPAKFCRNVVGITPQKSRGAFGECVRNAAHAQNEARHGNKKGGRNIKRQETPSGQFCRNNGANPGSQAYFRCLKFAVEALVAGRKTGARP